MSARGGIFLQDGDISAVPGASLLRRNFVSAQKRLVEYRFWQRALFFTVFVEGITQHNLPIAHFLGKDGIVIQLRPQPVQLALKLLVIAQRLTRQAVEHPDARCLITLGKYHVKAQHLDLVLVKQLVDHQRQAVARPRPAPLPPLFALLETFLVDIQDDYAGINPARHG